MPNLEPPTAQPPRMPRPRVKALPHSIFHGESRTAGEPFGVRRLRTFAWCRNQASHLAKRCFRPRKKMIQRSRRIRAQGEPVKHIHHGIGQHAHMCESSSGYTHRKAFSSDPARLATPYANETRHLSKFHRSVSCSSSSFRKTCITVSSSNFTCVDPSSELSAIATPFLNRRDGSIYASCFTRTRSPRFIIHHRLNRRSELGNELVIQWRSSPAPRETAPIVRVSSSPIAPSTLGRIGSLRRLIPRSVLGVPTVVDGFDLTQLALIR